MSRTLLNDSSVLNGAFRYLERENVPYYDQWLLIDQHSASEFPMTLRLRGPDFFRSKYPMFFVHKSMYD